MNTMRRRVSIMLSSKLEVYDGGVMNMKLIQQIYLGDDWQTQSDKSPATAVSGAADGSLCMRFVYNSISLGNACLVTTTINLSNLKFLKMWHNPLICSNLFGQLATRTQWANQFTTYWHQIYGNRSGLPSKQHRKWVNSRVPGINNKCFQVGWSVMWCTA